MNKTDKYELLGSLGVGGFGNVYKAVSNDGDIVALKTLNPYLPDDPKIVNKFFHEAKILSKLNHPNICKLIDFFADGPDYTIVMEYIDGTDLKELMLQESDNRLPSKLAVNIAEQCLAAFQYAFEMGVLHRDIKPSNIMIDKKGKSIITDFGISAVIDDTSYDKADGILSPAYSPPERFGQAENADIRSDIYSMGMVFYELFTGRKPFETTDRSEIESWHRNKIPEPVNRINPSLSPKITGAIKTALEKKQENRFKDFLEFKNAMGI
ncbi:MAG: serine/threonine-protein kinase [Desulfobacteraceae bacterium]|jgi:serine/threonine-protein kinase